MQEYILLIDTVTPVKQTVVLFLNGDVIKQEVLTEEKQLSEWLVPTIQDMFEDIGIDQLNGILCCLGPGGFTSTRVGVAVSNAIAFAKNIPVLGYKKTEEDVVVIYEREIDALKEKQGYHAVEVFYDKEPNITQPKK